MAELKNEAGTLLVVPWTLGAVIICMSTARVWVRWTIVGPADWDDLFNILATVRGLVSFESLR